MSATQPSLRNKLLTYTAISSALILLLTAFVLSTVIHSQLNRDFDQALESRARTLGALLELDDGVLEFAYGGDELLEFREDGGDQYFQLWSEDGTDVGRSPSLGEGSLKHGGVANQGVFFRNETLPDGREGRLVEVAFQPRMDEEMLQRQKAARENPEELLDPEDDLQRIQPGDPRWLSEAPTVYLVLARERLSLQRGLNLVSLTVGGALALCLVLILLVMRPVIDRGLSPLKILAHNVSRIDAGNLESRIHTAAADIEELAPIEDGLNEALNRLENAFRREKDFSANVAHELRTPLAELRSLCEVSQLVQSDGQRLVEFFKDTAQITGRMERTVLRLLELARLDAGQLRARLQPTPLGELIERLQQRPECRNGSQQNFIVTGDTALVLHCDADLLEKTLCNLLENAFHYGTTTADVTLTCQREGEFLKLSISNVAPDLKDADLHNLGKRFWRKDIARTGDRHAGLGLSLVRQWANLLELSLEFKLNKGVFSVTLGRIQLTT